MSYVCTLYLNTTAISDLYKPVTLTNNNATQKAWEKGDKLKAAHEMNERSNGNVKIDIST